MTAQDLEAELVAAVHVSAVQCAVADDDEDLDDEDDWDDDEEIPGTIPGAPDDEDLDDEDD